MRPTTWSSWRGHGRCGRRRGAAARRCRSSGRCRAGAPADIDGLLGFYAMDAGATFVEGTWEAVKASQDVALTAAGLVAGGESAFALCRPPGHHAGPRFAGGYCYLNNAAIAAEWLRGR